MGNQVSLNNAQVASFWRLMQCHDAEGEGMVITSQGDGYIYVAFSLASFIINSEGYVSDAE